MKYIALNGFRHPLNRYFNHRVECINKFNWTERNAIAFANTIKEPTTIIGFSDGATAALTIANNSIHVREVYAHSPMYRNDTIRTRAKIRLFRTRGDTTPTFNNTLRVFDRYQFHPVDVTMLTLPPGPHEPIRDLATLTMWLRNHQFRNCLLYLPPGLTQ